MNTKNFVNNDEKERKRSDSFNTLVIRRILKIPKDLLKMVSRESHYKSGKLKTNLKVYVFCFYKCFIKIYDCSEYDRIDLFLDFIILSFPKDRIQAIFEMIKKDPQGINIQKKLELLEEQRPVSLSDFRKKINWSKVKKDCLILLSSININ